MLGAPYLPHPSKVCVTSTHGGSAGGPTGGEESLYYHYLFSKEALQTEILLQGLLPGRNCPVVLAVDNFPLWEGTATSLC